MKSFTTVVAFGMAVAVPAAVAQTSYPTKPVRIIATSAPGGGIDFVARLLAQELTPALGRQFIVENRVGASGAIGIEHVARAAPDGYTLLLGAAGPLAAAPAFNTRTPFDPIADFAPVSVIADSPMLVTVHPSVPARSVAELIAIAKKKPGMLNFGSSGTAATPHLGVELFMARANIKMVHVPYKGMGPALNDLLGGQIDLIFAGAETVMPHAQTGRLRVLAAASPTRLSQFPEIPTVSESGLPGFAVVTWYGILAPAQTPPEVVDRLNSAIVKVMRSGTMRERLASQSFEPRGSAPHEFSALVRSDVERWRKLAKQLNLKL
jgi:tripartite-type tricarboxylate transporter receptor subunit TctC